MTINTAKSAPFGLNTFISYPDYLDLRDRNRTFQDLVAASYAYFGFSPNTNTLPRMKWGLYVSGNFFRALGVEPALGRGFRPDEDQVEGRDPVAILGHDFWAGQFGANPAVVGSRIRLNGIDFTIIGVAPARFTGIDLFMRPHLFVPLAMFGRMSHQGWLQDRDAGWLMVKGRLKDGVGMAQANADVGALSSALQKLHAHTSGDQKLQVESELEFRIAQGPNQTAMAFMLGLLALCVLSVACANVAGLLLSRARSRTREVAVRLAIGAGRGALIRQLLLENLLVAIAGGVGGLVVTDIMGEFWRRFPIPSDLPVVFDAGVDHRVLAFTLAISVVSTLLFGLLPAIRATRPDLVPALKAADADSSGGRRLWGRNAIVAGQIALSLVLLSVAVSLVQGFHDQLLPGPGYRTERIFLTSVDTQLAHYSVDQTERFYRDLLDHARLAPGIKSAALTLGVPMQDAVNSVVLAPEGWQSHHGEQGISTFCNYVSDGYFETMRIPILHGRGFRETDGEGTPFVAIVNEQMANHFWKGDALGKRLRLATVGDRMVQIVGIARQSKYLWIAEPPTDFLYMSFRQHPASKASLLVESESTDASTIAPVVREVVRKLDPDMPVFDQRSMKDLYDQRAVKTSNLIVQLVGGMGLIGLALASIGLYGLVAYSVSRRTREIGIRMALGAEKRSVIWMVLSQGLRLALAGVGVGLAATLYICPLITSALSFFAFRHVNPMIFIGMPVLLFVITMLASWAPARHAAQVDPLTSLHDE